MSENNSKLSQDACIKMSWNDFEFIIPNP